MIVVAGSEYVFAYCLFQLASGASLIWYGMHHAFWWEIEFLEVF
jgi:hypothetical protein